MAVEKVKTELLKSNDAGISKAVQILKEKGTIIFPTETVYGIGADANSNSAIEKIFAAKNRPKCNPLIVHLANKELITKYAEINETAKVLIDKLMPGPLTLILPLKDNNCLSRLVTAGLETVALRVPKHEVALNLLSQFGGPLAAPSANISGKISTTRLKDTLAHLYGKVSGIIDGGNCSIGLESTIISCQDNLPLLLRPGGLNITVIERLLQQSVEIKVSKNITSPGQMVSHYAPNASLRLNARFPTKDEVYLAFGKVPNGAKGISLSISSNITEAGTKLFSSLADLDDLCQSLGKTRIAVAPIPNKELGVTINDRLARASAPRD